MPSGSAISAEMSNVIPIPTPVHEPELTHAQQHMHETEKWAESEIAEATQVHRVAMMARHAEWRDRHELAVMNLTERRERLRVIHTKIEALKEEADRIRAECDALDQVVVHYGALVVDDRPQTLRGR